MAFAAPVAVVGLAGDALINPKGASSAVLVCRIADRQCGCARRAGGAADQNARRCVCALWTSLARAKARAGGVLPRIARWLQHGQIVRLHDDLLQGCPTNRSNFGKRRGR